MKISRQNFLVMLNAVKACYATNAQILLPEINEFANYFDTDNFLETETLDSISNAHSNPYFQSLANRIIAIGRIINARESKQSMAIGSTWNLIAYSISCIPPSCTISSIGSQGFLSIPLYKLETSDLAQFDFIRLHIWDNSLNPYIDQEATKKFSIHTHTFFAQSWILCGEVVNDRFAVVLKDKQTDNSLFTVEYNKSLNEINQHTSSALNNNIAVDVKQTSHEVYFQGGTYCVAAGQYHRSDSEGNDGLAATIFSFTGKNGLVDKSYVVGPSNIQSSSINRKMHIDPTPLLHKIDVELGTHL